MQKTIGVFFCEMKNEIKAQICFSLMKNNENRFKLNTSLNFMLNGIKEEGQCLILEKSTLKKDSEIS